MPREGLRLPKEREEPKRLRLAEPRHEVAAGVEPADKSQLVSGPPAVSRIRNPRLRGEAKPVQMIRLPHVSENDLKRVSHNPRRKWNT
jgi:hypothetical protein